MVYLWVKHKNCTNRSIADYDPDRSPSRYFLLGGKRVNEKNFSGVDCYLRSRLDLPDDELIRMVIRPAMRAAYIFTADEFFYCASGIVTQVDLSREKINALKVTLCLTDADIDQAPRTLTDDELKEISFVSGCPNFSRTPILDLSITMLKAQKYDSMPNNSSSPLVNEKIINLLLKLAPDDVQFFDAEVRCNDGVLTNYKLLNATHTIVGIDHEKSIYTTIGASDSILGFKYLTYKPGCMGDHKVARDRDYMGHLLVTEEIKQAFEKEHIKGIWFVRPEEWYSMLYPGVI